MHILLVRSQKHVNLNEYGELLTKRGVSYELVTLDEQPTWAGSYLDERWLNTYCAELYKTHAERFDAIQFFFDDDDWQSDKPTLRGFMKNRFFSGYLISAIKMRPGYEDTAEHELLHKFDNWVYVYLGVSLSGLLSLADWDEQVVHGKSDAFEEYEYDNAWALAEPWVERAITERKRRSVAGLQKRLLYFAREQIVAITKQIEEVGSEPSLSEQIYQAALKALGTDASPSDLAPDELGCAESVSMVLRSVLPDFPVITGTWTLWDALRKHPRFHELPEGRDPRKGDIIISPTGEGNGTIPGHVGIVTEGQTDVFSSNSTTGVFERNYSIRAWRTRYEEKGGFPTFVYRAK